MGAYPTQPLGDGTMTVCQQSGVARITAMSFAATESLDAGSAATCINLTTSPSPPASACGSGVDFDWVPDIEFFECSSLFPFQLGQIDDFPLEGRVYPTTGSNSESNCGYSPEEINALRSMAVSRGGLYLLVMCGNTVVPNDSTTSPVCFRGASVWTVVVAYTAANADDCASSCILGSCAGGFPAD
jgi:hypothetical protein